MDYSEFKLLDTKKTDRSCPNSSHTRVDGHTHGSVCWTSPSPSPSPSKPYARVRERPLQSAVGLALASKCMFSAKYGQVHFVFSSLSPFYLLQDLLLHCPSLPLPPQPLDLSLLQLKVREQTPLHPHLHSHRHLAERCVRIISKSSDGARKTHVFSGYSTITDPLARTRWSSGRVGVSRGGGRAPYWRL